MSASFTYALQNDGTPLTVQFTDTSTGGPSAWSWDFGDGSAVDTTQSPSHTFETVGSFDVVLTTSYSCSGDSSYSQTITASPSFNCTCVDTNNNDTLADLRRRLLVRLGYSAQADNPPPGMSDLLDDFLQSEQRRLFKKYKELRTERLFFWVMEPNIRFYDFDASDNVCPKVLDPLTVTWVGLQDLNNVWFDMRQGIPPSYYTSVMFPGYPSRYEFRSCIEVFPAPSAAYKLWIKGRFGLENFTADTDKTTIDSELVFLHALALAKAHYGQVDANSTAGAARDYLLELTKHGHQTARYVPGTAPSAPWTKPHFLPLDSP